MELINSCQINERAYPLIISRNTLALIHWIVRKGSTECMKQFYKEVKGPFSRKRAVPKSRLQNVDPELTVSVDRVLKPSGISERTKSRAKYLVFSCSLPGTFMSKDSGGGGGLVDRRIS